jgi:hypothetical protein
MTIRSSKCNPRVSLGAAECVEGFETFARSYLRGKRNRKEKLSVEKRNDFEFLKLLILTCMAWHEGPCMVRGGRHLFEGLHVLAA